MCRYATQLADDLLRLLSHLMVALVAVRPRVAAVVVA
jgi:hypothetical protein